MKKESCKYIFNDVFQLTEYIRFLYGKLNDYREISPIKLQKSLYFLFAFWGGLVEKSKDNINYVEYDCSEYSPYLFENEFQAWVYGPVLAEVYKKYKDESHAVVKTFDEKLLFNDNLFLKETIDSILKEIFAVADFKLVSISHDDNCWKNHFEIMDLKHETIIPREEIINEYAKRESII